MKPEKINFVDNLSVSLAIEEFLTSLSGLSMNEWAESIAEYEVND
jgi:hypothetical protein